MAGRIRRLTGWALGCVSVAAAQYNITTFHGDPQRTGWMSKEAILNPRNVAGGNFGPGPPWVTSNGTSNPIVWVLVANVNRSASLLLTDAVDPTLYALDPETLQVLWSSTPAMLHVSGKYNAPGFGPGMVFVGTDRIQAFGVEPGRREPGHRR